jgi:hypothetical protein
MTLSIKKHSAITRFIYCYAECRMLSMIMLNVVMLSRLRLRVLDRLGTKGPRGLGHKKAEWVGG